MNLLIPSLLTLAPAMTSAAANYDDASRIERSYNPEIEVQKGRSSWSLYGCAIDEFQIVGQDPVTLLERTVSVSLYRAKEESRRAVVILPPTGGVNILDQGYANELCSRGITVALVSGWEHQNDTSLDFNMHNDGALRALSASRHVIEFLQVKGFRSVGILGTSVGAVASSLVLSFEPRISSAVLIVGGARFADIVAESDEAGALALRKSRMTAFAFKTAEEYRQALRKEIWVEPSNFIGRLSLKDALVVSADGDTTVPTLYQLELARTLNATRHIRLRGNHLQAIKNTFWSHRGEIADFFLQTLAEGVE